MGEKPSPSIEELLTTYIVDSKARLDQHDTRLNNIETHCTNMGATMKTLETQVGQLANTMKNQISRSFPSNTNKNTKECNAITLRSGKELGPPTDEKKKVVEERAIGDALDQMQNYAKFMKEVMSKNRKLEDYETIKLTEECSAIIKRQLLENLKDPGSFTIPCVIGELHIEKAFYDLGAKVKIDILTFLTEDVILKIDKFFFPVDFVVLDMDEEQEIPIILGRPFLATGKALIDVHNGNLTLRVNGGEVKFNISNAMKFPKEQANCNRVDIVTPCLRYFFKTMFYNDPL
ncbi:uncharacterized protein LOC133825443 [Humulus lupulus]|uniref:uncharacterized protein LOC133825443 n=1 Tax=Humulus lupulus TaxID=3486 RepID=UPI002B416E67|nr:uncharacterized protein LOC133825443 [Humulus lupulus]